MEYRILGETDDITECWCCGKKNLKSTVAIETIETGIIEYLGCVCAARKMGRDASVVKNTAVNTKTEVVFSFPVGVRSTGISRERAENIREVNADTQGFSFVITDTKLIMTCPNPHGPRNLANNFSGTVTKITRWNPSHNVIFKVEIPITA